jgi:hypothetical protein
VDEDRFTSLGLECEFGVAQIQPKFNPGTKMNPSVPYRAALKTGCVNERGRMG